MNDWYLSPKERVLARLHTSERGLTTHEAKIILDETGENTLKEQIQKKHGRYFWNSSKICW